MPFAKCLTYCLAALLLVLAGGGTAERARAAGDVREGAAPSLPPPSEKAAAAGVMERVYTYARRAGIDSLSYTADVYLRHTMYTRRGHLPVVRYVPGMLRLERGLNAYLTEARLRLQLRAPAQMDCRVVAYTSTARYQSAERLRSMGRFNFCLYEPTLFFDGLLNPLHRRNRRFYRYRHEGLQQKADSLPPTARIRIRPRFQNEQLAEGYIDADPATGAVVHFHLTFRHRLRRVTVDGYPGLSGKASALPERLHVVSDFRLGRNRVYEVTHVLSRHTFYNDTLNLNLPKRARFDLTDRCLLRIDTSHVRTGQAYFDSLVTQLGAAASGERLPDVTADWAAADTLPAVFSRLGAAAAGGGTDGEKTGQYRLLSDRTQDIFLSSHRFNLDRSGMFNVRLPAIISPSMVQWSGSRGVSLKARLRFTLEGRAEERPTLQFSPMAGYSFKQRQVYWQLPLVLRFAPCYDGALSLEAGGGSRSYNNRQADELRQLVRHWEHYDTLEHIIDRFGFHDYRDAYARADASLSPLPGLTLTIGVRYHRRTLTKWNRLAQDGGLDRYYSTCGPRLMLEWTPAQYYYRRRRLRLPLYSRYPTLQLCYERGYGTGPGDTHYERLEAGMRYRLPLYALRTLFLRAGAGLYTQRGRESFIDYDFFRFSYMPSDWTDDMTCEFQTLSARWYNESRYYLMLTSAYESPLLLLSRLPLLSRAVLKERIYLNLLSVRALGGYGELGYGLSTHLVNLGLFMGMAEVRHIRFGFKFVLHFFDQ